MDAQDAHPLESRPPTLADLLNLCRRLNEREVQYIVIGGMAVIQHGFVRATGDIDLLVDASPENDARLREALLYLPDQAVKGVKPGDIEEYTVVRVADEIVIDLMKSACGIDYKEAARSIITVVIEGVRIPFASLELLWKLKQSIRERDALDREFLRRKLRNGTAEESDSPR